MYIRGIFYFDSQPPFGKQLIAMVAYLSGFNGNQNFTAIGAGTLLLIQFSSLTASSLSSLQ